MTARLPLRAVARQAWADRGLLALGLVVLTGVTALATVTPRELDDAATREVRAAVGAPGTRSDLAVVAPLDESQVRELRVDTGQQVVDALGAVLGALPATAASVYGDPVGSLVGTQLTAGALHGTPLLVRPVLLVDGTPADGGGDETGADENGSDETGSDENGSDENGSDEDGADENGSDEGGAADTGSADDPVEAPRSWHVTDASAEASGAVTWLRGGPPQGRAVADGLLSTGSGYLLVQRGGPGYVQWGGDVWPDPGDLPEPVPEDQPMPVAIGLSEAVAALLGVEPGDTIDAFAPDGGAVRLTVSGVFRAVDPAAPRWGIVPTVLEPREVGGSAARVEVGALVSAGSAADVRLALPLGRMTRTITLPVRPERLDAASADAVARSVAAFASAPTSLGLTPSPMVSTSLDRVLDQAMDRVRITRAQAGLVLTGVLGAALLVLALATSVVLRRRAEVLGLHRARGAGLGAVAAAQALEHVPLVVLGGAAGVLLAGLVRPGPVPWAWVLPPLLLAAVGGPALAAAHARRAGAPPPAHVERRRTAAALRRPLAEVALVVVAVAALASVRARGVGATSGAADLPLLATPALVAAAVAVLLARVLPPLVHGVRRATARGRGAVGLLAGARVQAQVLPLAAVTLASAVLALALGVQATVRAGTVDGSWRAVGGDVAVAAGADGWVPEDLAGLAGTPGVEATALARVADALQVLGQGVDETSRVVAVDPAELAALLAAEPLPGAAAAARALDVLAAAPLPAAPGDPIPALVAGLPADATGAAMNWQGEWLPLDLLGPAPQLPAVPRSGGAAAGTATGAIAARATVVVSRAALAASWGHPVEASAGWAVGPGATGAVRGLALGDATVTTRADWLDATRTAPAAAAFARLLVVAAGLLLALAALAVQLDAAGGAPARAAAAARLRVLGVPRSRTALVALAEVAAPALVAAAAGVLVGLGLLATLTRPLGLATLTGQAADPAAVLPWAVVWPVPVVAAAAVLAVLLAARRRERLGQVLRTG